MKKLDLSGQRFGRLVAADRVDGLRWKCLCDCGRWLIARTNCLRRGCTRSCGCLRSELVAESSYTHGMSRTPLHRIWLGMKRRCTNPSQSAWNRYGGRGIFVCDEWVNDFMAFYNWSISNGYDHGLTIDRIDNDGGYEPSNCRWATDQVQRSNKSTTHMITAFGETKPLFLWALDDRCSVGQGTLTSRIRRLGWSPERAISAPARTLRPRNKKPCQ